MLNFRAIKFLDSRDSHKTNLVLHFIYKTSMAGRMRELSRIFRLFLIAQKIPTWIKLPKKYLPKFSYPKISQKQKFHPSIIPVTWNPEYSLYPPPPPLGLSQPLSIYLTQCIMLVKCWKPWDFTTCPRSMIESTSNQGNVYNCLRSIKKHFVLLDELNCIIRENG